MSPTPDHLDQHIDNTNRLISIYQQLQYLAKEETRTTLLAKVLAESVLLAAKDLVNRPSTLGSEIIPIIEGINQTALVLERKYATFDGPKFTYELLE